MSYFGLSQTQIHQIEEDFLKIPGSGWQESLAAVLNESSEEEALCLKFLYAYMPVSDLASYPASFFQKVVRDSLEIRRRTPWGENIDGEMFLNYVLALRLNNENLTDHRMMFFEDIFPRIKDLPMTQAALEVNYWCFEHATYHSTDDRTNSPLSVLLNAYGRCGEESVLYVAALRSVGIPARQTYTPRWAHCDDNHAWVEIWGGDRWYWMGACEPEPILDRGWFVETSKRAMLTHARVFSRLISEPEVTNSTSVTAQVNNLVHYAPTKRLSVHVTKNGAPVENAEVRFQLANFAEMYPILIQETDAEGSASMLTGYGDVYVQVTADGRFLCQHTDADCTDVDFHMENAVEQETGVVEMNMVAPPPAPSGEPEVPAELVELHHKRIEEGAACRQARIDKFLNAEKAAEAAREFPEFQDEIASYLEKANGNWEEILKFLRMPGLPLDGKVLLLSTLRLKDYADSEADMLASHLEAALPYQDRFEKDLFASYILCPRVQNEWLTAFRKPLSACFTEEEKALFVKNPQEIWNWIETNIADCGDRDYATISATPDGLAKLKVGSRISREIMFVDTCRMLGIPARLSPLDAAPEYWAEGWQRTTGEFVEGDRRCVLTLVAGDPDEEYGYRRNFTVARLDGTVYQTLGLDDLKFEDGKMVCKLESGIYRVMTCNRQPDGTNMVELTHVELKENAPAEVVLNLHYPNDPSSNAAVLPEVKVRDEAGSMVPYLSLIPEGVRCAVAIVDTGKEPTEHLLNELLEQPEAFAGFADRLLLIGIQEKDLSYALLNKAKQAIGFKTALINPDLLEKTWRALSINNPKFPLVMDLEPDARCGHFSYGYNVGTGDRLLTHFRKK